MNQALETQKLRFFVTLAEQLHFTRASEILRVSQPHLSREVRSIEKLVGAALLDRTTRNVRLTRAGEVFYRGALKTLDEMERTVMTTRAYATGYRGHLRVGFVGSVTYSWLPYLIDKFRVRYPDVRVDIQSEMLTGWQVNAIVSGNLDVGVLRSPVEHPNITTMRLSTEPMLVALPAGHRLSQKNQPVALTALRDEDFVIYSDATSSVTRRALIESCVSVGFEPKIAQTVENTHTLVSLVAAGMGVSLVPAATANFTVAGVVYHDIVDASFDHHLSVAWKGNLGDSRPVVRNFVALTEEHSAAN